MYFQSSDQKKHKSPEQLRKEKLDIKIKDVKQDHAPGVIKYLLENKKNNKSSIPLHEITFRINSKKVQNANINQLTQFNNIPYMKKDDIREEKWQILSKNCINLLQRTKLTLSKSNNIEIQKRQISQESSPFTHHQKQNKFLSRRQSIEQRLSDIKNIQLSPQNDINKIIQQQKTDSNYQKFQKHYKKIGLQYEEYPQLQKIKYETQENNNLPILTPQRKNQSLFVHFTPQSYDSYYFLSQPKNVKKNRQKYLYKFQTLCNDAQKFYEQIKKDETQNYEEMTSKINSLILDFHKFQKILIKDQDSFERNELV